MSKPYKLIQVDHEKILIIQDKEVARELIDFGYHFKPAALTEDCIKIVQDISDDIKSGDDPIVLEAWTIVINSWPGEVDIISPVFGIRWADAKQVQYETLNIFAHTRKRVHEILDIVELVKQHRRENEKTN